MSTDTQKWIIAGSGIILAGAVLWYLSQDGETVKYDPQEHTLEKLRSIVHEVFVQSATHQQQIFQVLKKMEEN